MKKLGLLLILLIFTGGVFAENFESERYKIQFGDINIGGDKDLKSSTYDLSVSLGQTAAGEFQSNGYIVKAGFQYIYSIIPFRFSISNTNIDFGTLAPHIPVTKPTTLTVSFGGAGDYQVTAAEAVPLRKNSGTEIVDTSCDGGSETCSEAVARQWKANTSYGFGYNMSGHDIPSDFLTSNYFRPFPDLSRGESPQVVMTSPNVGRNRQAVVTFKANIGPTQEAGSYQTVIQFTATPGY